MTPTVTIQELALALTAKNHSPTLLNSDFLKYSGIVPPDWELARPLQGATSAPEALQA
jgi:hypothetical protein